MRRSLFLRDLAAYACGFMFGNKGKKSRGYVTAGCVLGGAAIVMLALRSEEIEFRPAAMHPAFEPGPPAALVFPGKRLTAIACGFENEVDAYEAASELRQRFADARFLVTLRRGGTSVVRIELPDDLLQAIPLLERMRLVNAIGSYDWAVTDPSVLRKWRDETEIFDQIYSGICEEPATPRSNAPEIVSSISALADFYAVPLALFRAVRQTAGETRSEATWRNRLRPSDVVFLRTHKTWFTTGRNTASWQELRKALEHAHALYRSDERDYRRLPVVLRPHSVFREEAPPGVLLTYAGLLLRDLLDKTNGSVPEALDAYNAAPDNPNVRQDIGVRRASLYARRVLRHAIRVNRNIYQCSSVSIRR